MTRRPASPARSVKSWRPEKSYVPSSFSQAVHSIHVRTVLKPRALIWAMSLAHASREAGVTVSSMGARALPPEYQTETGKKPLVLSGPAAPAVTATASRRAEAARTRPRTLAAERVVLIVRPPWGRIVNRGRRRRRRT